MNKIYSKVIPEYTFESLMNEMIDYWLKKY